MASSLIPAQESASEECVCACLCSTAVFDKQLATERSGAFGVFDVFANERSISAAIAIEVFAAKERSVVGVALETSAFVGERSVVFEIFGLFGLAGVGLIMGDI